MSLSGLIEQVSVVELLQFVHLGHRSGTLHLRDGARAASVSVHRGRTVGATSPDSLALGPLLVERQARRRAAGRGRAASGERPGPAPSLDAVLVELKAVTARRAPRRHRGANQDLHLRHHDLDDGVVRLRRRARRDPRGLSPAPGGAVPAPRHQHPGRAPRGAARADERAHAAAASEASREAGGGAARPTRGAPADAPPAPFASSAPRPPGARRPSSSSPKDVELARQIGARARRRARALRARRPRRRGRRRPDEDPPVVLLDLRAQAATLSRPAERAAAAPARARSSRLPAPDLAAATIYAAGATAVVTPDAEVVAACATSLYASLRDASAEAAIERGLSRQLRKGARPADELRAGGVRSTTLSLNLMAVVRSRSSARCCSSRAKSDLKATRRARERGRRPAARRGDARARRSATRRTRALVESVADGRTRHLRVRRGRPPGAARRILGARRARGEAVTLPRRRRAGPASLLYADNGAPARAPSPRLESIEIATAQVGPGLREPAAAAPAGRALARAATLQELAPRR